MRRDEDLDGFEDELEESFLSKNGKLIAIVSAVVVLLVIFLVIGMVMFGGDKEKRNGKEPAGESLSKSEVDDVLAMIDEASQQQEQGQSGSEYYPAGSDENVSKSISDNEMKTLTKYDKLEYRVFKDFCGVKRYEKQIHSNLLLPYLEIEYKGDVVHQPVPYSLWLAMPQEGFVIADVEIIRYGNSEVVASVSPRADYKNYLGDVEN